MLIAVYALIILGVMCATWAVLKPWSSAPMPEGALAPAIKPLDIFLKIKTGKLHTVVSSVLTLCGKALPRLSSRQHEFLEHLVYTGVNLTGEEFTGLKVLAALGGLCIAFIIGREFKDVPPFLFVLGAAIGFMIPDLVLRGRVRRRQQAIVRLLPEVIDILSLCIGAGLDFLASLNKVVLVKSFKKEPLIEELSIILQEIKLGKRRFEALKGVMKRVNVPEISSFVRTLVQADRMGTPIAEVLSIHSEDIRFQRFMRAERMALKAPVKILAPLIFCIMPCVALIVGAPIFLQFLHQNPFMQQ